MTAAILLDYHNVISKYEENLPDFMSRIDWGSFYPSFYEKGSGVVICIGEAQFEHLDSLPEEQKIGAINELDILSYASVIFDEKKGLIILGRVEEEKYLGRVLESLLTYLPNDDWIFAVPSDLKLFIANGFAHPLMVSETPLGDALNKSALGMFRKNEITTKRVDAERVYEKAIFASQPGTTCTFSFSICARAQSFLEQLVTRAGVTFNKNKTITQKEISGGLKIVGSSKKEGGLICFVLGLDEELTEYNQEEEAGIAKSLYNFHTHPKKAYINHNVKFGWPSADDYSAFLRSIQDNLTIFHLVASVEGFYIISLGPYWAINYRKLDVPYEFIARNYDISKNAMSVKEYVSKVNGISYGGERLFALQFSRWGSSRDFEALYPRWHGTCFYSEKALDLYRKFYG